MEDRGEMGGCREQPGKGSGLGYRKTRTLARVDCQGEEAKKAVGKKWHSPEPAWETRV